LAYFWCQYGIRIGIGSQACSKIYPTILKHDVINICRAIKEGDKVVAAVRNPSKIPDSLKQDGVATLAFDLAWPQEKINSFAKEAIAALGRLDVVVNNAGYAYMGAIEESSDEQLKGTSITTY